MSENYSIANDSSYSNSFSESESISADDVLVCERKFDEGDDDEEQNGKTSTNQSKHCDYRASIDSVDLSTEVKDAKVQSEGKYCDNPLVGELKRHNCTKDIVNEESKCPLESADKKEEAEKIESGQPLTAVAPISVMKEKVAESYQPITAEAPISAMEAPTTTIEATMPSSNELHTIFLRGCIIEGRNIPLLWEDDHQLQLVKVLYIHPQQQGRISSPLVRSRKVIHETSADDSNRHQWQSSFLWNIRGEGLEKQIRLHGYVGEVLFCIYAVHRCTKQRHFIGECLVKLDDTRRNTQWHPLFLRDGRTPIATDAALKLEIEVFLPKRFDSILVKSMPSEEASSSIFCNSFHSATPGRVLSKKHGDICAEVSERRRVSSQRRFEKRQNKLLEENERIQLRLKDISIKPRRR